ncbi:TetR/AcrR family transcriptional regulator [Glaciihabitans sp. dw_435]|uniref:TetR/AcrR family transcriptional regulator n=1 Tax=Glaciihabitans sp. dw_435 TaxID=2720081 RepID=UPI001BD49913|nr:TetR family transcriptional regulator [Glaciihabitans sp. dw_435]
MGRWEPGALGRMQQAAFELYAERGFEQTTVADIAERAGLTERTFFRHFADKREVLFFGSESLVDLFTTTIIDAPADATPLQAITAALEAAGPLFDERRAGAVLRQSIISANTPLMERELMKMAKLTTAVAAALRTRGLGELAASVTADLCVGIFTISFQRWILPSNPQAFGDHVHQALAELAAITAAP